MGDLEFEAKRQYLTHDLDLADLASRDDDQARQAVAWSIAEQQAMDQTRRNEQNAAFDQEQRQLDAKKKAAAKASGFLNPLDRGPYDSQTSP
jgi:hypothetical protein